MSELSVLNVGTEILTCNFKGRGVCITVCIIIILPIILSIKTLMYKHFFTLYINIFDIGLNIAFNILYG